MDALDCRSGNEPDAWLCANHPPRDLALWAGFAACAEADCLIGQLEARLTELR